MGVEDEVDRHTIVEANKSRKEGTEGVLTVVLDLPQAGGVKAAPEIGKQKLTRNVGIVARKATMRASVGRSAPSRINPDSDPATWHLKLRIASCLFSKVFMQYS